MLQFSRCTFYFEKSKPVITEVSFTVTKGECILLAGPNGSGKTVLMKHSNGLLTPRSGSVLYNGVKVQKQLKLVRQKVGIVFQNSNAQFVGQTVKEDISFGPENLGWEKKEIEKAVQNSAELMGINNLLSESPHFLSGGEKRRTAVAGILAMDPDLIIFDEPFTGLDLNGVKSLSEKIVSLKDEGHTLIIISHDVEKTLAFATRLILLNSGKIVYDGDPIINEKLYLENNIHVPFGKERSLESCTWL
jgi:biotin transport system ATP-binding protein